VKCDSCLIYVLEGDELVLAHPKILIQKSSTPQLASDKASLMVAEHGNQSRFLRRQRMIHASSSLRTS
jgi:hypothetical protein